MLEASSQKIICPSSTFLVTRSFTIATRALTVIYSSGSKAFFTLLLSTLVNIECSFTLAGKEVFLK
jgi:hypothetical protein